MEKVFLGMCFEGTDWHLMENTESSKRIWAVFLTGSITLLQLVKIKILDPSGGVLSS